MNKESIITCYKFLNELPLNKITNRNIKEDIISNILQIHHIFKEYESDLEFIKQKLFSGKENEIQELSELREKYSKSNNPKEKASITNNIIANYSELLELEDEFQHIIKGRLEETVELNLRKISKDSFLKACLECGKELVLSDLIQIKDILY